MRLSNRMSNAHNVTRTYLIGSTAVVSAHCGCLHMLLAQSV